MQHDVDFFVIGGGSGGVRAARFAAQLGARVALAEDARLGGTCVNVGCVPKKLFSMASHVGEDLEDGRGFGWSAENVRFDWGVLKRAKDAEIARLNGIYERLLLGAGVEVIRGRAALDGPNAVRVGDRTVSAAHILIATGGRPVRPSIPGAHEAWVSDDLFELDTLPKHLVIAGGGYIGCEFASIFRGLGVDVDLVVRGDRILRGFDDDVRDHLTAEMGKRGVRIHGHSTITRIERTETGVIAHLSEGVNLPCGQVLLAAGRTPNTEGLGLADIGVATTARGAIEVDAHFRTSVPSIRAVGDVIDRVQLTPVALAEGMFVAHELFGDPRRPVVYENIPTAVFTTPNVGTVGQTEAWARARGPVRIYRSTFKPMKHTLSGRDERMLMKLVVCDRTDRVLGVHVVGPEAGEIVQGFAVALTCGATKAQLDATIGIHPTAAEELVTLRTPV